MWNKRIVPLAFLATVLMGMTVGRGWAQSNFKEIMALPPAELAALLLKADAGAFDKAKACQRLAVVGTKDSIPALVSLLPDEKLNLYARFGLEGIPDPAVDDALRAAATRLQGRQQVGVIDSIGQRKDAKAVDLLKGLLGNSDAAVASAAAGALGRIGTPEAAAVLRTALGQRSPVQKCVADASLACAEGLAAAGDKAAAIALYEVVGKADLPKHLKLAALAGQFRALRGEGKDLLLGQLRAEDRAFFRAGLAAARYLPGPQITAALADALNSLPPERQALVLLALGDRQDPPPLSRVIAAAKSDAPVVREAAIVVLSKLGDASVLPILMDAALSEGPAAAAAKEGLIDLAGEQVDAAIVAKLGQASGNAKIVLLEIAGIRRIAAATTLARQAMTDADEPLRLAALAALGQLVELRDVDLLFDRAFAATDTPERKAARGALTTASLRMADREAIAAKLASVLAGLTLENKVLVLELLGRLAGPKALETVAANARSDDDALKDAATRVLGDWPNPEAADAVLAIATTEKTPKYRIRALRGYIRIARQLQFPDDQRLAMFHTAMGAAQRPDEKQLALDILSRIPSVETLRLAVSFLNDPTLKGAAGDAAVKIAAKVVSTNAAAVAEAMEKVVRAKVGGKPAATARQLLEQAKANAT